MKGFVNSAGRFALLGGTAVALALSASAPASAASMVDAGLGKRVSDLEAEVRLLKNRVKALEARKGGADNVVVSSTSRVKVTLYGQVNRSVRGVFASNHTELLHSGTGGSSTRFGLLARGRIDADWTITGQIETEWTENRSDAVNDTNDSALARVRSRHLLVRLTHASLGSITLGHTSIAADGSDCYDLSGTSILWSCGDASILGGALLGPAGPAHGTAAIQNIAGAPGGIASFGAYGGVRENLIRYDTPRIMGFRVKVSHSELDKISAGVDYAGTPFGNDLRVIAAFGWDRLPGTGATSPANAAATGFNTSTNTLAGSAAILHVPSGLSIQGGIAAFIRDNTGKNGTYWWVKGGWQAKIWALGKSNFAVGFGKADNRLGIGDHGWHVSGGFVQEVDPAFSDLYIGIAYADGKRQATRYVGIVVVMAGARIKF